MYKTQHAALALSLYISTPKPINSNSIHTYFIPAAARACSKFRQERLANAYARAYTLLLYFYAETASVSSRRSINSYYSHCVYLLVRT